MPSSTLQQIQVRIPPELRQWLVREADARMVSTSYLVVRALEALRAETPAAP